LARLDESIAAFNQRFILNLWNQGKRSSAQTATRTKFGAHFWRRLIANIDLAQNDPKDPFGATIWQRFGESIKHLCISIFEIMI
jgi:hypothetical protein